MRKLSWICFALLVCCSCRVVFAEQVEEYRIGKGDARVIAHEPCGDGGTCFSVDMAAPGRILSIEYFCEGDREVCAHVYPCPDVGKRCGGHGRAFEIYGNRATFWAWTNSGNPNAVYRFRIHYI